MLKYRCFHFYALVWFPHTKKILAKHEPLEKDRSPLCVFFPKVALKYITKEATVIQHKVALRSKTFFLRLVLRLLRAIKMDCVLCPWRQNI